MRASLLGAAAVGLALAACTTSADQQDSTARSAEASGASTPSVGRARPLPGVVVARTLTTGLNVPWGLAFAPDGTAYLGERGTGRVLRRRPDAGAWTTIGVVPGVVARGEGGLLGLAVDPADPATLLAYLTTSRDNRVVRMPLRGDMIGVPEPILTGIPAGTNHNGGRLLVGPGGTLFVGTGDATERPNAQDPHSLGGKILRITTAGTIPPDNPFPGSPVYSLGHRNVQGLAFDSAGRLWATEFGQNAWDELNLVVPGGNFGWPVVEGIGRRRGYLDPQVVWPTDDASPSGLAIVDDVAYVAALRGQRLWQVGLAGGRAGTPRAWFTGELGRLRTVVAAPGGGLWLTTSNTDGRGDPRPGDDRVLALSLHPADRP